MTFLAFLVVLLRDLCGNVGEQKIDPERRRGYRNGYEPRRLKTAEGKLHLDVPQVRGTEETYRSEFLKHLDRLGPGLRRLAIEMYARGLSTRDIEEALRDKETGKLLMSKDAVSALTQELWEEYERFCERDLSGFDVVYLFVDAVCESLKRMAGMKEAILCCWAITSDGHKVLPNIGLRNKESYDNLLTDRRATVSLEKEKIKVFKRIKSLDNVILGVIFDMKRYCGKKDCSCAKTKTPHRSMFLSFKYEGKTRMVSIRKEQIPQIKKRINDYKELKAGIDDLTRINAEMLRSEE